MPPNTTKMSPLTKEEQDLVTQWVPIAEQVARRYSRTMALTGVGDYEDALGTAYEALCVAARLWDPAKTYQGKPHRFVQLICGQMVRASINKALTGAHNRQLDLQTTTHAVQVRGRFELIEYAHGHHNPWPRVCAQIDVDSLTKRSGQYRGTASLLASARGVPLREHTTDPISRQAIKLRQDAALRKLKEAAQ